MIPVLGLTLTIVVMLVFSLHILRGEDITKLKRDIQDLRLHIKYLQNREEGDMLAYHLARELGYSPEDAEIHAHYGRIESRPQDYMGIRIASNQVQVSGWTFLGSMEAARNKLNELIAKRHEDCMRLNEEEEKLIREKREEKWK
jgi:hypothetical protein